MREDVPDYVEQSDEVGEVEQTVGERMQELVAQIVSITDDKKQYEAMVKELNHQLDDAKKKLRQLMEENMLTDFVTSSGHKATMTFNARGQVVDWSSFFELLNDRKELGLVSMKFSGRLHDVLTEFVRQHADTLNPDDVEMTCPWNRMQSWLKEVARERNMDVLDLSIPGLDINSWTDVRVK